MIDFEEFSESMRRVYSDPLLKRSCLQAAVDLYGGTESLIKQVFVKDVPSDLLKEIAAVADAELGGEKK